MVNLSLSTVMTVVFFRCLEAMYGTTTPSFIENSLSNYLGYYSSVVPFVWDPKTETRQKISMAKLQASSLDILGALIGASLVLSFLNHVDFAPFESSVQLDQMDLGWNLLSFSHLANAYCHAWLIYLTLKMGFELTAFNENIKGYDTYRLFDAPFFQSRTPTEFWTQRWNMLTRPLLKVRRVFSVVVLPLMLALTSCFICCCAGRYLSPHEEAFRFKVFPSCHICW